jgi:Arc/MetJ family transcription regulator
MIYNYNVYDQGGVMKGTLHRTNVVLDAKLVDEGKKITGLATTRAVLDYALRELARRRGLRRLLALRGKATWEGDLNAMRRSWRTADHAAH